MSQSCASNKSNELMSQFLHPDTNEAYKMKAFGHAHGVGVQSRYKICNAKKHVGV